MNWLRNFMAGRCGMDQLSIALLVLSMGFTLASSMAGGRSLWVLPAYLLMGVVLFRMLSRNREKRFAENQRFQQWWQPLWKKIRDLPDHMRQRRTHCFFACAKCGQKLRVPRGKGKIAISCPKCGNEFTKKT